MTTPLGALSGLVTVPLAWNTTSSVCRPNPPGGGRTWNRHSNGEAPVVMHVNVGTTGAPVEASRTVALMFTPAGTLSRPIRMTRRLSLPLRMNGGLSPVDPKHFPPEILLHARTNIFGPPPGLVGGGDAGTAVVAAALVVAAAVVGGGTAGGHRTRGRPGRRRGPGRRRSGGRRRGPSLRRGLRKWVPAVVAERLALGVVGSAIRTDHEATSFVPSRRLRVSAICWR